MILTAPITCPACGAQAPETMPTDACQILSVCAHCGAHLRPKPGDCCIFCSYGGVPCPPIQEQDATDGSQGVGMTDTTHDELAALTAEAEAMSQRFEDEERAWQAQHSAGNVPDAESRGGESAQRTPLALLQETIASSRTLLAQAELPSSGVPLVTDTSGESEEERDG